MVDWQGRIRSARNEEEVVAIAREFCDSLPPERLACLPPDCRPGPFAGSDDVLGYNLQLARAELMFAADDKEADFVREILQVMMEAANRLTQLSLDGRLPRPRP